MRPLRGSRRPTNKIVGPSSFQPSSGLGEAKNSGATPLGTTAMVPPKRRCQVSRAEALTAIRQRSRS